MEQTPSCKYFRLLADEYIEGELTGEEMREFEAHIAECHECRKEFEELRALKEMLTLSDEEIPEGLHKRIMNAVSGEIKPKKNKLHAFRRAAISAACAVICLSLTLIFTIMPLWQEETGSGLPGDPITDATAGKTELLPTDTQGSLVEAENSSAEEADSLPSELPEQVSTEEENDELTLAAESTAADVTKIPDTQPETIIPETAKPETEAAAVETERPSTEAPEAVATEAPAEIEPPRDETTVITSMSSSLKDEALAPSAESNTAPGGDEITLALLIVSGLLAVASFIAFLISLSSVRNTPSKKKDEEEK